MKKIKEFMIRMKWYCPGRCGFDMEDGRGRSCPYCNLPLVKK